MTTELKAFVTSLVLTAEAHDKNERSTILSAVHTALDNAGFVRGEERRELMVSCGLVTK